jgi:hypothetical protein
LYVTKSELTKLTSPSNGEVPVSLYSGEHVTMEIVSYVYQVTSLFNTLNEVKPIFYFIKLKVINKV